MQHPRAPRSLVIALLAALAAIFALPQVCFACSCVPPKPPLEAAADASAVFRARVVEVQRQSGREGYQYQRARVQVTTVWKGTVMAETMVYTGSGGGDCGFNFQRGEEYIIYAYTNTATNDWPSAGLTTSICTRTRTTDRAADDLAALGPGQAPTPGLPNTGSGTTTGASSSPLVPGELLVAGGILAFFAVAWRGSTIIARRRT